MDPKSKKAQTVFDVNWLHALIDGRVEARGGNVFWGCEPCALKIHLDNSSCHGKITFFDAHKIINEAHTSKMRGDANKGLGYIIQCMNDKIKDASCVN